jgi:hypothetical protein
MSSVGTFFEAMVCSSLRGEDGTSVGLSSSSPRFEKRRPQHGDMGMKEEVKPNFRTPPR